MIALDTSAIVAVLRQEPNADRFVGAMAASSRRLIGRPTELELQIVMQAKAGLEPVGGLIAQFLRTVERVDFGEAHLAAATVAFDRFGKGRHPASLNYGDCMAYAVAKVAGCPLLYKGEDFARTDIRSAL
ncbi:type II toxin-antitoxin system VapC family toxin [Sphingomonas sp. CLY1604]|uniref:type II toxin-antitoxin system VapC family toxin n=1 Tax=Sphingomonas sp. CLY1604 TaxID=3457786 RepID=UPI003FD7FA90